MGVNEDWTRVYGPAKYTHLRLHEGKLIGDLPETTGSSLKSFASSFSVKPVCQPQNASPKLTWWLEFQEVSQSNNGTVMQIAAHIFSIIYNKNVRKSTLDEIKGGPIQTLLKQIAAFVREKVPVKIVLIAWPFKFPQNPLKTNRSFPDLGELMFVKRLLDINEAVKLAYEPGIQWTILSEGEAYGELLGVSAEDATRYKETMAYFIHLVGGEGVIILDCLHRVLNQYQNPNFETAWQMQVERFSFNGDRIVPPPEIQEVFPYLLFTMFWSLDVRMLPLEELLAIYCQEGESKEVEKLEEKATTLAIRYAAFQLAKNCLGSNGAVVDTFPNHLYLTITSKTGRFAIQPIHPLTRLFPHHGVPVVTTYGGKTWVNVVYLADVLARPNQFEAVYLPGDPEEQMGWQHPFFYSYIGPDRKS